MTNRGSRPEPSSQGTTPLSELFLALFRAFAGYLVLFASAILILRRPPWELSVLDACFWLVLALLVLLRWREGGGGVARFSALHLGAALVVWAGANSVHLLA